MAISPTAICVFLQKTHNWLRFSGCNGADHIVKCNRRRIRPRHQYRFFKSLHQIPSQSLKIATTPSIHLLSRRRIHHRIFVCEVAGIPFDAITPPSGNKPRRLPWIFEAIEKVSLVLHLNLLQPCIRSPPSAHSQQLQALPQSGAAVSTQYRLSVVDHPAISNTTAHLSPSTNSGDSSPR